jgi:hypothetical protein
MDKELFRKRLPHVVELLAIAHQDFPIATVVRSDLDNARKCRNVKLHAFMIRKIGLRDKREDILPELFLKSLESSHHPATFLNQIT